MRGLKYNLQYGSNPVWREERDLRVHASALRRTPPRPRSSDVALGVLLGLVVVPLLQWLLA